LGCLGDVDEVISHEFFKDINFTDLLEKKIEAPFKPKIGEDKYDVSNFDSKVTT
jgi:hypothetical protein